MPDAAGAYVVVDGVTYRVLGKMLDAVRAEVEKALADGSLVTLHVVGEKIPGQGVGEGTLNAFARTIETGEAHYWSRSRGKLWRKGEESGNRQRVVEMRTDCDQDAIWLKVEQSGAAAACHTGRRSCFYRVVPLGRAPDSALTLIWVDAERQFDPSAAYRHGDDAKGTLKGSE